MIYKTLKNSAMPSMDYMHTFYNSQTLFAAAKAMAERIRQIIAEDKLTELCFVSASSSGATITTAVMALLYEEIPCNNSYVRKSNWTFRYHSDREYTMIKNESALYMAYECDRKRNIFILDDCIDTGATTDYIYDELKKLGINDRLNRIIVQQISLNVPKSWTSVVECFQNYS